MDIENLKKTIARSIEKLLMREDLDSNEVNMALEFIKRIEVIVDMGFSDDDLKRWFISSDEYRKYQNAYRRVVGDDQLSKITWEELQCRN